MSEHKTVVRIFLSGKGRDRGTYIRVGATTGPADEDRVTDLLMEGKRISWDELPCIDYPVDREAVLKLCNEIASRRKKAGLADCHPDEGQLISLNVLKQDERGFHATNAFALLTSEYFRFGITQCAMFKGRDHGIFLDKHDCTGPIYEQIDEAVRFVLKSIRLEVTIGTVLRHEKYELPPEAIREMIVNAICHRDYRIPSCVQVAVYDDRVEVTSPGSLYGGLSVYEMMQGHSRIRNRAVAATFQQMGIIEHWGTGIRRICQFAEEYNLPAPKFTVTENFFRIELFRKYELFHQLTADTIGGEFGGNGGDQPPVGGEFGGNGGDELANNNDFSSFAECLLQVIAVDPHRTAAMLAKELGVSLRTVEREISALRKAGIIVRKGSSRIGYWQIMK